MFFSVNLWLAIKILILEKAMLKNNLSCPNSARKDAVKVIKYSDKTESIGCQV